MKLTEVHVLPPFRPMLRHFPLKCPGTSAEKFWLGTKIQQNLLSSAFSDKPQSIMLLKNASVTIEDMYKKENS
ncbi:hypothetical protein HUB98_13470 [Paenibacillus barcinonensis]|uniref:Uncharacterized protein n=1 Tax=Paenibacillus barcinonensis TaxID=198119 RepID=A0A2V4VBX0_PAEBA|nr:hypothetical protein [Paenibacillus barcinonensis]PYE43722.1 hypothetical protein DFQ00_12880 [Paenibacillus barcinonensis]QKS57210.1 hypothetical protein HUB98_13470 [Paenibacillus barcinonensis]